MTESARPGGQAAPGLDEIVLSDLDGEHLCFSLQHKKAGTLATVLVTFGELGLRWPDALWYDSWGESYPMCPACWEAIRRVAVSRRPGLVIHDTAKP